MLERTASMLSAFLSFRTTHLFVLDMDCASVKIIASALRDILVVHASSQYATAFLLTTRMQYVMVVAIARILTCASVLKVTLANSAT